jgi:predicted MPP superfamily phosphohydrolase
MMYSSMKVRSFLWFLLALLFLAAVLIALRAAWLEPSSLRLPSYTVPQSSPQLKGLRIAVISDLHAGAPFIDTAKIDRVVAMTNAARPDLVLLTGDYVIAHVVGGHHMPIETIVAGLRRLHAPLGVYAVLGNHDRWEDPENIARVFRQAGIPVLENSHLMLPAPRNGIALVGIGDRSSGGARPYRALKGVNGAALCFTHSPDIFPMLRPTCALTIAGHTHGGQIWLPFLGRPAVAALASSYGQKYAIGIVREDNKTLFVSSGIGTSGLPLRFGVPPEISLLTVE